MAAMTVNLHNNINFVLDFFPGCYGDFLKVLYKPTASLVRPLPLSIFLETSIRDFMESVIIDVYIHVN